MVVCFSYVVGLRESARNGVLLAAYSPCAAHKLTRERDVRGQRQAETALATALATASTGGRARAQSPMVPTKGWWRGSERAGRETHLGNSSGL